MTFKDYVTEIVTMRKPLKIIKKGNGQKQEKLDLNIKRKNYKIEFNNLSDHELIPRILNRTKIDLKEAKSKFEKAIDYVIKKNELGFFKNKSMVEMTMKKSEFKIMIMINPDDNYIRVSTVLSMDMPTKNTIKWNMNEENIDFIQLEIDE